MNFDGLLDGWILKGTVLCNIEREISRTGIKAHRDWSSTGQSHVIKRRNLSSVHIHPFTGDLELYFLVSWSGFVQITTSRGTWLLWKSLQTFFFIHTMILMLSSNCSDSEWVKTNLSAINAPITMLRQYLANKKFSHMKLILFSIFLWRLSEYTNIFQTNPQISDRRICSVFQHHQN